MFQNMKNQKGFTLIELILVIVILGILTAVALPKFIDLDEDARVARRQGALAAFRGAVTMLHGKFLIQSSNTYSATDVAANTDVQGATQLPDGSTGNTITMNWGDGTETFDYIDNLSATPPAPATVTCAAGNPC